MPAVRYHRVGEIRRGTGSRFDHADLPNGISRYYWITTVDDWGNESTKFPASNTAGIVGTTRKLSAKAADGDFDATALAAPQTVGPRTATVSFDQDNQDVNGDGKVDIAFTVSYDALADSVQYETEVSIASAAGGPWTVSGKGGVTGLLKWTFSANTNRYYKTRTRGINAYGQPGDWTTQMYILGNTETFATYAGYKPAKKTSFVPTGGVGTPTAVSKPKGFMVNWPRCTDADYRETALYRFDSTVGTVEVTRTKTNAFADHSELVIGRAYQYSIAHVDNSLNVSATSALATAVVYRGTLDTDNDQTLPAAPSAPSVAQGAKDMNGDGVIDMTLDLTGSLSSGAKSIEFEVDFNYGGTPALRYFPAVGLTARIGPVVAGKTYSIRQRGISFNDNPGPVGGATTYTPTGDTNTISTAGLTMTSGHGYFEIQTYFDYGGVGLAAPPPNYAYSNIIISTSAGMFSSHILATISAGKSRIPALDYVGTAYVQVQHFTKSGQVGGNYPTPNGQAVTILPLDGGDLGANVVTNGGFTANDAALSLAASTATNAVQLTVDRTDVYSVRFDVEFMNDDSVDRKFFIRLYQGPISTGTIIKEWSPVKVLSDGGHFHGSFDYDTSALTGSSGYVLAVSCASATTISHRKIEARRFKH